MLEDTRDVPSAIAPRRSPALAVALGAAAGLAALAILNMALSARAERRHPPKGKFLDIDGVRLHFLERGGGKPLVMLHGNGGMIEELEASGLIAEAAKKYRVLAFDRPGFGHSTRPRDRAWSPQAQADLIARALDEIGVERAAIFGHSWGTLVALALAIEHPAKVSCLVLASGYYFSWPRADVVFFSGSAIPVIGDLLRYTVQPLISRAIWPLVTKQLFSPAPVAGSFASFPRSLALRPSQLRAVDEETALMIPSAAMLENKYRRLDVPLSVITGEADRIVRPEQAEELHDRVAWSRLSTVPGAGHMVHHTSPQAVMSTIDFSMAKYE